MHPILFKIGPLTIRSYGFMIAVGMLLGMQYLLARAKAKGIPEGKVADLVLYTIIAGLLGGRIAYILINLSYYLQNPLSMLKVWEGGLVYYGGFIAGIAAVLWYVRRHREIKLPVLADLIAPALALGHGFGRIGCFLAGCCYGSATQAPWGVTYANPDSLAPLHVCLHPTQLYEAFGNLVIFVLLDRYSRREHRAGLGFAAYLLLYGIMRFSVEFFRNDDRGGFLAGFSPSQLVSVVLIISSLGYFWYRKHESNI